MKCAFKKRKTAFKRFQRGAIFAAAFSILAYEVSECDNYAESKIIVPSFSPRYISASRVI